MEVVILIGLIVAVFVVVRSISWIRDLLRVEKTEKAVEPSCYDDGGP